MLGIVTVYKFFIPLAVSYGSRTTLPNLICLIASIIWFTISRCCRQTIVSLNKSHHLVHSLSMMSTDNHELEQEWERRNREEEGRGWGEGGMFKSHKLTLDLGLMNPHVCVAH